MYDRDLALRHNIVCLKQDYSSPVTVARDIDVNLLGKKRHLPGVLIDDAGIRQLGSDLGHYAADFPWRSHPGNKPEVPWDWMFPTIDSLVLYAMIRHFKPKSYIEVGCGYSSHVSSRACEQNREDGINTAVTYIEPYPGTRLAGANLCGDMVVKKIQDLPLEFFDALGPGDMLFIDTSHIMKLQSDVEWELLHVLPSLKKGVIIHIHDIYTPYEYPTEWIENSYAPGFYNEQYALEALLSGGDRFKTLFPLHALCRDVPDQLLSWFGTEADSSRSYWVIVD